MKKIVVDGVEYPVLVERVADDGRIELDTGNKVHSVPSLWWRGCNYWVTLTTANHLYEHVRN